MNVAIKVMCCLLALGLGGCISQSAREYRELQNRTFRDKDARTRTLQRAAALFPEIHAERRRAFDSGGKLLTPKLLSSVAPKYPKGRAWREVQGGVWVAFVIAEDGSVSEAHALMDETLPADPAFADSALVAVKQWRFTPATLDGKPMRYYLTVPVLFEMRDGL